MALETYTGELQRRLETTSGYVPPDWFQQPVTTETLVSTLNNQVLPFLASQGAALPKLLHAPKTMGRLAMRVELLEVQDKLNEMIPCRTNQMWRKLCDVTDPVSNSPY